MVNLSDQFVNNIFQMAQLSFPKQIMDKARNCFIDYIAVAVAGSKTYMDVNMKFLAKNQITGKCHIIGLEQTSDLTTAVMINAFNAHVLELDDSHRVAMTHVGAPVFSALLGVAEIYECTIEKVLHAAIVGYEAAICLADAIQPSHKKRGFHVSGTCCTVGCAMGVAAMLNYSKKEMSNVFSAASSTAAGLLAVISGKSEQKPYNVAHAAVAGVNAALYGRWFAGAEDILSDSRGFFRAMSDHYQAEKLFRAGYAIEGIYQKLYAACRHCHAPMEAMLLIRSKVDINLGELERIEVKTYGLAIDGHDHTKIEGVSSAKQSIPYGVAVAYLYKDCGLTAFTETRLRDKVLLDLVQKVDVKEDVSLTSLVPEKRAAVVTVLLKDGSYYSQRVDYPKGEPENPITRNEMLEKFYTLTQEAGIHKSIATELLEFVSNAEDVPAVRLFQWI